MTNNNKERLVALNSIECEQIVDLKNLVDKVRLKIFEIEDNIENARNLRKNLKIETDFELIETIDSKINKLSIKKCSLKKEMENIVNYLEKDKNV